VRRFCARCRSDVDVIPCTILQLPLRRRMHLHT
jgi:hypothetical protein